MKLSRTIKCYKRIAYEFLYYDLNTNRKDHVKEMETIADNLELAKNLKPIELGFTVCRNSDLYWKQKPRPRHEQRQQRARA